MSGQTLNSFMECQCDARFSGMDEAEWCARVCPSCICDWGNEMATPKDTSKIIKEFVETLHIALPNYKITLVIRNPDKAITINSVLVVSNDDPKKVLEAIQNQAVIQPNFGKPQ